MNNRFFGTCFFIRMQNKKGTATFRNSPFVFLLCNSYASVRFFMNNRYPSVSTTPTGSEIHADCTNPATM